MQTYEQQQSGFSSQAHLTHIRLTLQLIISSNNVGKSNTSNNYIIISRRIYGSGDLDSEFQDEQASQNLEASNAQNLKSSSRFEYEINL